MADVSVPQIDYSGAFNNVPQPGQAFTQGLQSGLQTQDALLQQQIKRYQFGRMQQMQGMAAQVAQNPTPENISQLSIAFPEMSENFKRSYDMLQPTQQRNDLNFYTQVYAAAHNGRPEIAADLLNQRADAMQNSGADPQKVQSTRAMAQWATEHPDSFKLSSGVLLAGIMGPEKFTEAFKGIPEGQTTQDVNPAKVAQAGAEASTAITSAQTAPQRQAADIAKTNADANKLNADVTNMAGRLALDRDTLMSNTQTKLREMNLQYGTLQPEQQKLVNDSAMNAAAGEQSASRLGDLANRLEDFDKKSGGGAKVAEAWKAATGTEDGTTAMRQEYARIVNNQALSATKDALGGRVTDVDMKAAMGTVPSPTASVTSQVSYLRGVQKLQQLDAARQQAQAEWIAKGGRQQTLGPAVHDMEIMGTKVPAGTTFADFSRQFLQQKANQISAQSSLAQVKGRSYLRFAQPTADAGGQPQTAQAAGATGTY